MPSDIRSFFSAKGSQGAASSQEIEPAKPKKPEAAKPKSRSKRKVVEDDSDEEEQPAPKKSTPSRAVAKKAQKKEEPKEEATTTSEYFGSSKRVTRSTPTKAKPKISTPQKDTQSTPTKKDTKQNGSKTNTPRTRSTPLRPKKPEKVEDAKILDDDIDSGEDIHGADFKRSGKKMEDEYQPGSDEELDGTPAKPMQPRSARGRKRKSEELSDSDDGATKRNGTKSTPKKQPPKKPKTTPKKAKDDEPEDSEMKEIFDSIPTVRPPTPPQRDASKKFDWRAAQKSQPAPPAQGTKEIPDGAENCLAGLTFVFTGVLNSLGRDEGVSLVKKYGGKVTGGPSSKTDYVVLGSDAGPKKLETISKLKIKTIDEDGLFALVSKLPANGGSSKAAAKFEEKRKAEEKKIEEEAKKMEKEMKAEEKKKAKDADPKRGKPAPNMDDELWTTKYAPTTMNQICGNKTQVEKLQNWLRNWHKSAKYNFKKGGPDGSGLFRSVMLHGGPGIGKTTAAHLAAKLEGFDIVENNASDTRNKKLLETGLRGVLDSTSLNGYFAGDGKKAEASKKKMVLIMDEVDGMSAGDRGGVGAMAAICRKTSVPIILICNDRRLPKMKPFDHVVFDLPFRKPTVDQVRARIMTILFREGMKDLIPTTVVNALIEGSGSDIRRIINMISTAKIDAHTMDYNEGKKMTSAWEKHVILKPWDITQKILAGGMFANSSKATLNEKIELYFNDHEFSSLMLQENYLGTQPMAAQGFAGRERSYKLLELADRAAESISDGDLCDAMIHGSQQQWSLMPTHAVFSFVRPASFVAGTTAGGGGVRFTSWLGNNSKTGKLSRFVKEIQSHMRLRCAADRHEIRQQYLPVLWTRLVKSLEVDGEDPEVVESIIDLMDSYFITKDDWDAMLELGVGPQAQEKVNIKSQVKSSFTRKYNAASHPLPFMKSAGAMAPMKKSKDKPDLEEAIDESEDDEVLVNAAADDDGEESELDLKKDKYVQAPKKKKAAGKKKAKKDDGDDEGSGEEKGKGKAKAKAKGKGKAKK